MVFASIVLVLTVSVFAAIVWWAYAPRFKKRHEKDGMIPFLDSQTPPETTAEAGGKFSTTEESKS